MVVAMGANVRLRTSVTRVRIQARTCSKKLRILSIGNYFSINVVLKTGSWKRNLDAAFSVSIFSFSSPYTV